ncbi:MAG: hypothetical protein ACD_29C00374G0001 [uncultured bacterium]|nr:MAG: hypothetical protein ACD_29C00374G0001 [uncultured bacterium]
MNGAVKKANEVCTKQGKKLVVLSHKTKYQGAGKELGTVTSMASQAAFMIGNVAGVPTSKTATDYKTTLEFECQ